MYLELAPSPPLKPYVQLLWCLELAEEEAGAPDRIAPDGVLELVFQYRDPMEMRHAGEEFVVMPRASAVSQTRRWVEIRSAGATGLVSVRFRPWGAYHFLGMPISELADLRVDASDVWGRPATELEERLGEACGVAQRVALVEGFLLEQLRRHQAIEVEPLVRAIWRHHGQVKMGRLCADLGLGERRLQRIFSAALGMAPKSYARLTRFLHACSELRGGRSRNLTRLAVDCGYYDQAHFIADCRAFSGMTPRRLAEARSFSFLEIG